MKRTDQECGSCQFYRPGDVRPKRKIVNAGLCTALEFCAPFWAQKLMHYVIDWQGQGCPAWRAKSRRASAPAESARATGRRRSSGACGAG